MTQYTLWQNQSLYAAAGSVSDAARRQARQAFFGSIHATLSHLLWGDQLWLHRLAGTPAPAAPDIPSSITAYAHWDDLCAERQVCDANLARWSETVTAQDLAGDVSWYSGAVKRDLSRPKGVCVVQLFNHGTHHRGQVHTMLTQAGAKPDDTDVPFMPVAETFWASLANPAVAQSPEPEDDGTHA